MREDRKALKREYKEKEPEAGIWIIRNLASGKILLGSSPNLESRFNRHRFALGLGNHECAELQDDWKRLGGAAFRFEKAALLKRPKEDAYFDLEGELKKLEALWSESLAASGEPRYAG